MKTLILLTAFSLVISGNVWAGPCGDQLTADWENIDFRQKKERVQSLTGKQIDCLFSEFEKNKSTNVKALVTPDARRLRRVERYFGKNSLPVASEFEKHFFYAADSDGYEWIYGYNLSEIGKLTKSPGFFQVNPWGAIFDVIVLDYRPAFDEILTRESLNKIKGIYWKKGVSNRGNLIFGNLTDVIWQINEDLFVGRAYRLNENEKIDEEKFEATFLLLRMGGL